MGEAEAVTLEAWVRHHATTRPTAPALLTRRGDGWATTTWAALDAQVDALAARFVAAGIQPGDRVALVSESREEWVVADLAIVRAGATTVTLYPATDGAALDAQLADADVRGLVVERAAALTALAEVAPSRLAGGLLTLAFDEGSGGEYTRVVSAAEPIRPELQAELRRRAEQRRAADAATVVYTSGTSGEPRGVVLSHAAIAFQTEALAHALTVGPEDRLLLLLPLAHVFGRIMVATQLRVGCTTAFAESLLASLDNAEELKPTLLGCVPRFYEKVHATLVTRVGEEGALKHGVFQWAVELGRRAARLRERGIPLDTKLAVQLRYADRLVLRRIRERFGGQLRFALSGGAPLAEDLCEFYHAAGITLLEGYGLTEACGATHLNTPDRYRFGTVGRPLPGVRVAIDDDGEVLIASPSLMTGYHGRPRETAEALRDGVWLATGDVGTVDADGFLTITDRKKDILVTAHGKKIAPQAVEARLLASPWLRQVVVCGEGRPYLVALVSLDEGRLAAWAREHRVAFAEAPGHPALRSLLRDELRGLQARLPSYEQVRDLAVLARPLSLEGGELTASLKVRRRVVTERYAAVLDALYAEGAARLRAGRGLSEPPR